MSLGTQKGIKRSSATETEDYFAPESADAALARSLQLQEYKQIPSKRRKVFAGPSTYTESLSDDDSLLTELDDDDLYEEPVDKPASRKTTRTSSRFNNALVIPDTDDLMDGLSDSNVEDYSYQSNSDLSDSSSAVSEEEPLIVQSASRNNIARIRRLQSRQRLPVNVSNALASGMSFRVSFTSE
jgi:DNA repair protein RAD16